MQLAQDRKRLKYYLIWLCLGAIILFVAAVRIRLLAIPLERDEGEYAYAGQLILQGIPPYAKVYNMKMPGVYFAYALILAIFGQTHIGVHAGLLVINAITILLIFMLTKRLFGYFAGIVAAGAYSIFSLCQSVLGFSANTEHFVMLMVIPGMLLLDIAITSRRYLHLIVSGLFLGLAFLMKQHAAAFIVFAALYLMLSEIRYRPFCWKSCVVRIMVFCACAVLPFALIAVFLWYNGIFERFWFWTFQYAGEYVKSVPFFAGLSELRTTITRIIKAAVLLWGVAAIGFGYLIYKIKKVKHSIFALGFFFFSFLAVCPGFYFRNHYFILLLASVAIFVGIGADFIKSIFEKKCNSLVVKIVTGMLLLLVFSYTLYRQRSYLFFVGPAEISRAIYGLNPFPESLQIASYIREHSSEDDCIAVMGSEPQIYFYCQRRSATGYIYTYPLMEKHHFALKMQKEMVQEIEAAKPKFIVYVFAPTSWLYTEESEGYLLEWLSKYQREFYKIVGIVEIRPDKSIIKWDEDGPIHLLQSEYWIHILRRK